MRDGGVEFTDEADSDCHPALCIRAKRPIPQAEPSSDEIDERIQREQKLIANVAGECQPLHVLHHGIQFVSVNDQNAFATGSHMDGVFLDVDVSVCTKKAGHQLIVISWTVNYASAFAGFAQDFLDDVVMLLRPINSTA